MFKGALTAIVTPFLENGDLDLESFKKLVQIQLDNEIDGIVPCGTTGESPTLEHDEQIKVVKTVLDLAKAKTKVVAGAGSNSTKHAVEMTKEMANLGADATLQVNPYYNKPTQEGLFRHFSAIAKAAEIPVILYNIKGRTAVNLETATLVRLAKEHSNIVAVKEASGDIEQMKEVINTMPKEFDVLSGDDNMALPLMKLGGKGVISVASNILPKEMHEMTKYALDGEVEKAEEIHNRLMPLFKAMFLETNPIPVKTSLALKGIIGENFRLPMCEMQIENKEKLKKILTDLKVI
jgi:4-hydroxy-tetrahydrodipicolinate synthase